MTEDFMLNVLIILNIVNIIFALYLMRRNR